VIAGSDPTELCSAWPAMMAGATGARRRRKAAAVREGFRDVDLNGLALQSLWQVRSTVLRRRGLAAGRRGLRASKQAVGNIAAGSAALGPASRSSIRHGAPQMESTEKGAISKWGRGLRGRRMSASAAREQVGERTQAEIFHAELAAAT